MIPFSPKNRETQRKRIGAPARDRQHANRCISSRLQAGVWVVHFFAVKCASDRSFTVVAQHGVGEFAPTARAFAVFVGHRETVLKESLPRTLGVSGLAHVASSVQAAVADSTSAPGAAAGGAGGALLFSIRISARKSLPVETSSKRRPPHATREIRFRA